MGPNKEDRPRRQATDVAGAVVFMTAPEAQMRLPQTGIRSKSGADTRGLAAVLERRTVRARPMFGLNEDRLAAVAGTQLDDVGIDIPDLSGFYRVRSETEPLADLAAELRTQEGVIAAWVEPIGEPPVVKQSVTLNPDPAPRFTPDFSSQQGYLDAAPGGVDARYAWTMAGGGGASVRIFDVELGGWQFTHEDLRGNQGGTIGNAGTGPAANLLADRNHATAVIGELGGDRNTIGILGVAPEASVRGAFARVDGVAAAIRAATDLLGFGDLIIVEAHAAGPRFNFMLVDPNDPDNTDGFIPMEWWEGCYRAMRYAAAHGVIVLEAAGNGAENLDDDIYDTPGAGFPKDWRNPFRRTAERDSGAIVVGAGAPAGGSLGPDRSRLEFSNFGSMVDAQGWGGGVVTSGYGDLQGGVNEDQWYTRTFSGTSSALPIVAGALACVQGARSARIFDQRLDAATARAMLRSTGTPQTDAPGRPASQRIGNLPSIGQMLPGSVIYAVAHQRVHVDGPLTGGDLWWYRHLGRHDGTPSWAAGPRKLTGGWARVQAFAGGDGDGVIYTIAGNDDLHWRRHIGAGDGSNTWSPTVKVGNGWDFEHVFAGRGGAIYAVRKFGIDPSTGKQLGGNLVMYDHLGWSDGTPRWNGEPKLVGTGWHFDHIFAGDEGRIYAINRNGELWRYIHTGRGVRSNHWELPEQIGRNWHFQHVFHGGGNTLYAIDAAGDLWWDRDEDTKGPLSGPPTKKVGQGWDVMAVLPG